MTDTFLPEQNYDASHFWWGRFATLEIECPKCFGFPVNIVAHLNDKHEWTYLQIADWLENGGNNANFIFCVGTVVPAMDYFYLTEEC